MRENVEYLQRLGLTEYQAKAMVVILNKRETTAKEISDLVGVPLTKVYQVLKSLEDKELLECSVGKPRLYRGPTPNSLINKLLKKEQRRIENLTKEKEKQMELIKEIELEAQESEKIHPCLSTTQYKITE